MEWRPGTMRWARDIFHDALLQYGVVLDERHALDVRLDKVGNRVGVTRQTVLAGGYVNEQAIRAFAAEAATEHTGTDPTLLRAAVIAADTWDTFTSLPEDVRNYLIDHEAERIAATEHDLALTDGELGIQERGLLHYGYAQPAPVRRRLEHGSVIPIVSFQHRDAVREGGDLTADRAWGRPTFEWAYRHLLDEYRNRISQGAERLLWGWADLALVYAVVKRRDDSTIMRVLAGMATADQVIVVARVPEERLLPSSHALWDGLVLRGRYVPTDVDDAIRFVEQHGSCAVTRGAPPEPILESWHQHVFANGAWDDVRLQVCLDRIAATEITDIIEIPSLYRVLTTPAAAEPGIGVERLT